MSDSKVDRAEAARRELGTLAKRLREQAGQLGDAHAIAAADHVHEQVSSPTPNMGTIRAHLQSLETQMALSPTVNAILQALSNIGI